MRKTQCLQSSCWAILCFYFFWSLSLISAWLFFAFTKKTVFFMKSFLINWVGWTFYFTFCFFSLSDFFISLFFLKAFSIPMSLLYFTLVIKHTTSQNHPKPAEFSKNHPNKRRFRAVVICSKILGNIRDWVHFYNNVSFY